jgi:hypothetical protein
MMNQKQRKKTNFENGQSMVELAVSIVVLLILLAGVVDLGRVAFYYIAMRDAAQEGASYASMFPNDCEEIIKRVEAGSVDSSRIEVDLKIVGSECKPCGEYEYLPGDQIVISVKDPDFPITMPLLGTYIGAQDIELKTSVQNSVIVVPKCPSP